MSIQNQEPQFRQESVPLGMASALLTLLTAALWAGTPVAIRFSVEQIPPIAVAALRFALAAVFMLFWCRWEGTSLGLARHQRQPVLVCGCLLFVQISLFNLGVAQSSSSHGTILINTFVLWVAGLEHFVMRVRRLTVREFAGLMLAASGGILVVAVSRDEVAISAVSGDQATLTGDLILLASAFVLGIKIVYTRHALKVVEPGKLIFWHDVIGVVMFSACSVAMEEYTASGIRLSTALGVLYQGLFVAGFCFAIQTRLLRKHAASDIAVFSCLTPVLGIALGSIFRGDTMSSWLIIAGCLVASGIYFVTASRPKPD
jgi:drug/metabolite transporter (DMT)-like permease